MGDSGADYPTTIGADASFTGKLKFEKGARLLGAVDGEITTSGDLLVDKGGKLAGQARAGNIRVNGEVTAKLESAGKIQLGASARLEGDVQAAKLEVAEGAVLIGHCSIGVKSSGNGVKTASAPVEQVTPRREKSTVRK